MIRSVNPARRRVGRWIGPALVLLTLASILCAVLLGPARVPLRSAVGALFGVESFLDSPVHRTIVRQLRLPRALLGLLVGASLAVSGVAMQGLFRNPLASPYVLGIASGASTGAAFIILFSASALLLPFGAFVGSAAAVSIVYLLARGRDRRTSIFTLILAGVAVGAFFAAITSFLIYLGSDGEKLSDVLFWMMGGLGRARWPSLALLAAVVLPGIGAVFFFARDLNALSLGEEGARHVGVNPDALYRWLLLLTTLLTAAAVAIAGTIGFIGLVVPHVMRLLVGPDHRRLLPFAALAGGCFLVLSDIAARLLLAPAELPVGVITAFLGAPFFLYLLKTRGAKL